MVNAPLFPTDSSGASALAVQAEADAQTAIANAAAALAAAAAAQASADAANSAVVAAQATATAALTPLRMITWFLFNTGGFATLGEAATTIAGTFSLQRPTAGSVITSRDRGQLTSAATAGSGCILRNGGVGIVMRGNAAGQGGFRFRCKFGTETNVAQQRLFAGMYDFGNGGEFGNANPSTHTHLFGVGYDSAETVLSIISNDGTGTATKTSLGVNFPVDSVSIYDVDFVCAPNDTLITYTVIRQNDGSKATGTISADLPGQTNTLTPYWFCNNGTTASAVKIDVMAGILESYS